MQVRDYSSSIWFKNRRSLFRHLIKSLLMISLLVSLFTVLQQFLTDTSSDFVIFPLTLSLIAVYYCKGRLPIKWEAAFIALAMATSSVSISIMSENIALSSLSGILIPVLLRFVMSQTLVNLFIPIWLVSLISLHVVSFEESLVTEILEKLISLSYALLSYLVISQLFDRLYTIVIDREQLEINSASKGLLDHSQLLQHFAWLTNKTPDSSVRIYGIYINMMMEQTVKSTDLTPQAREKILSFMNLLHASIPTGASVGRLDNGVYILMSERAYWGAFEQGLRTLSTEAVDLAPIVVTTDTPNDTVDFDTALHNLDTVYARAQKQRLSFAHFSLNDRALLENQSDITLDEVSNALQTHQIEMYFQPKIDIQNGNRLVGAEALARWHHPERGLLTPYDFVEFIDNSPYRLQFIHTVIVQSAHFCETLKQSGMPITVSFNLSASDLQDLRVTLELSRIQERYGFSFGQLQIELSERETDVTLENLKRSLVAVKDLGYSVALDDFGTGMSSLAYFQTLPADTIKIDRAFIKGIHANLSSEHLTSMVVSLAKSEGIQVVAEGVETTAECDTLLRLGVDEVQGFLFGKPMSTSDFLTHYQLDFVDDEVLI